MLQLKSVIGPGVKRRYPRKDFSCQASLFQKGRDLCYVNIRQISEGGLLLASPKILDVGETVELQFSVKSASSSGFISPRGNIIYELENEKNDEGRLYGLRFISLEIFDKLMIQECVRSHSEHN